MYVFLQFPACLLYAFSMCIYIYIYIYAYLFLDGLPDLPKPTRNLEPLVKPWCLHTMIAYNTSCFNDYLNLRILSYGGVV